MRLYESIMNPDLEIDHRLKYISLSCIFTSMIVSVIVLIGWGTNHLILTQFGPTYKPQPIFVSFLYLLLNANLLAYIYKPFNRTLKLLAIISLSLIILGLTILLINDLSGSPLQIDQLFMLSSTISYPTSRISPIMITNGLLLAFALILLFTSKKENTHNKCIAVWLTVIVLIITSTILISYLYNSPLLVYAGGGQLTTTSLPAAITSLFLSIGLMTTIGKKYPPLSAFIGSSLLAQLIRVTITPIVILIIILNWINVILFPLNITADYSLIAAFLCVVSTVLLSITIIKTTSKITENINKTTQELFCTQEKLQNALTYNRGLIEASLDPLVTINQKGIITDVNQATEIATAIPREKLIGTDFSSYFTEPERAKKGYKTVLKKGFIKNYELTLQDSSGNKQIVL